MPFDYAERKRNRADDARRIYVCRSGHICVEIKHTRLILSPEEFIGLLRMIVMKDKTSVMPAELATGIMTALAGRAFLFASD